jgi:hypothetical protein
MVPDLAGTEHLVSGLVGHTPVGQPFLQADHEVVPSIEAAEAQRLRLHGSGIAGGKIIAGRQGVQEVGAGSLCDAEGVDAVLGLDDGVTLRTRLALWALRSRHGGVCARSTLLALRALGSVWITLRALLALWALRSRHGGVCARSTLLALRALGSVWITLRALLALWALRSRHGGVCARSTLLALRALGSRHGGVCARSTLLALRALGSVWITLRALLALGTVIALRTGHGGICPLWTLRANSSEGVVPIFVGGLRRMQDHLRSEPKLLHPRCQKRRTVEVVLCLLKRAESIG